MEYRRLGNSGVKVSALGFGSWVSFDNQMGTDMALECMQAAHDAGCNFFDNAEAYAAGKSEQIMGEALRQLDWPRWSYVVTTKLFWGIHGQDPNMRNTLNRKYLMQAIDGSLERFGLDFVDVVYCHRADPNTPMEETVWAMSDMVSQGKALYWGTSEWSADEIRHAIDIAERHHLHKPVTEQSQYNLLERDKVEVEYARLHAETGYGNTIWSPLAFGFLAGKYSAEDMTKEENRFSNTDWLNFDKDKAFALLPVMREIANDVGCSMAQLAVAWLLTRDKVDTVLLGATKTHQLEDNLGAVDVSLSAEHLARLDAATAIEPLYPCSDWVQHDGLVAKRLGANAR